MPKRFRRRAPFPPSAIRQRRHAQHRFAFMGYLQDFSTFHATRKDNIINAVARVINDNITP